MIVSLQTDAPYPRLVFTYDVDEGDEAPQGYRGDVVVEVSAGQTFPVYFFEPEAVREIIESNIKWGFGRYLAEPGMVVVPEITLANMKSAVLTLIGTGYFNHLRPVAASAADQPLTPAAHKLTS